MFQAYGNRIGVIAPSAIAVDLEADGQWALDDVEKALAGRLPQLPKIGDFVEGLPL